MKLPVKYKTITIDHDDFIVVKVKKDSVIIGKLLIHISQFSFCISNDGVKIYDVEIKSQLLLK